MGSGAKLEPSAQDLRGHAGEPRVGRGRLASVDLNFGVDQKPSGLQELEGQGRLHPWDAAWD